MGKLAKRKFYVSDAMALVAATALGLFAIGKLWSDDTDIGNYFNIFLL